MFRLENLRSFAAVAAVGALAAPTMAGNVGYYDMTLGAGNPSQVAGIVAAGETPVLLTNVAAADLVGIDVLLVQNPDNFIFGAEYLASLGAIDAAVSAGMQLVIHDRLVTGASGILPGGAGFTILRDFLDDANIDVLDNSTLVTNGPGGIIDDTSLDGGNSSSHGFAVAGTLPGDSALILTRTNDDELVTFCYSFGAGSVTYSSIPLDFYLGGGTAFDVIYHPNVIAYAAAGGCSQVAECHLVLGDGPGDDAFDAGNHLFETQVGGTSQSFEVLMNSYPELLIPAGPGLPAANGFGGNGGPANGIGLRARYSWTLAAQVLMWNPEVFPGQPEQYSGGLLINVDTAGRLRTVQYGAGLGGIQLDPEVRVNAEGDLVLAFPFSIEGF